MPAMPVLRSGLTAGIRRLPPLASASIALALWLGLLATPARVHAQIQEPIWIAFDSAPPGAPAEVIFDASASSASTSWFDVILHGFFVLDRTGPDGVTYQQVDVPGLEKLAIVGAPHLPIVRRPLALATDGPGATPAEMIPLSEVRMFGMHLWPEIRGAMDDPFGEPPVFVLDPVVYSSPGPYPATQGTASLKFTALGSIPASMIEAYPMRWDPVANMLFVYPWTRWRFDHDGAIQVFSSITKDRNRIADNTFLNWDNTVSYIAPNLQHYQGEYLFVYPTAFAAAIKPLVSQKKARGFTVTTMTTESIGAITCTSVRSAILAWLSSTPSEKDHLCLLVGDNARIPHCTPPPYSDPDGWTDDYYGSITSDQPARDIFIGRLPAVSAAEVSNEVAKIIAYEDHPSSPGYYNSVLLVAHKPDPMTGADYEASQDTVRLASYAVTPLFVSYYGSDAGRTNAGISANINTGYGITCYRGHGGSDSWNLWNASGACSPYYPTYIGECYTSTEVDGLANGSLTTIVLAIACENADLRDANCIARHWMNKYPGGAVAHYGGMRATSTDDNNTLEWRLFKAVWDKGITNLAHATTWAEDQSILWNYGGAVTNAWYYALFGDPDMQVRRTGPTHWVLAHPGYIVLSGGSGQAPLDIRVMDESGAPVPQALVSVWKEGTPRPESGSATASIDGDEVFDNTYSQPDGFAHFLVSPQTTGNIYFTVRDSAGNSVYDSIRVVTSTDVQDGIASRIRFRAEPSLMRSETRLVFGRALDAPAQVRICDVLGRTLTVLRAPAGATELNWRGLDSTGRPVGSGIFFANFQSGSNVATTRIVILR